MELPADLDLIGLQAAVLFRTDERGRLVSMNDHAGSVAPRFYLWRTGHGNVWRYRSDVPDDVVHAIDAVASTEPVVDDFRARPPSVVLYRELLEAHAPVARVYHGPAFRFSGEDLPTGDSELIHDDNAQLLWPCFPDLLQNWSHCQPCFAVIREGMAVSVCCSAYRSEAGAEAGVETHIDHVMQGYASSVVAAWSQAVRGEGLIPLYSTSWDNEPSLAIAHRLGLVMYGENLHIT